jgi:hypothetical protein
MHPRGVSLLCRGTQEQPLKKASAWLSYHLLGDGLRIVEDDHPAWVVRSHWDVMAVLSIGMTQSAKQEGMRRGMPGKAGGDSS